MALGWGLKNGKLIEIEETSLSWKERIKVFWKKICFWEDEEDFVPHEWKD